MVELLVRPGHQPAFESPSLMETGEVFQMRSQYSRMDRSEEKYPMRATLRMDMRVQFSPSL